MTAAARRLEAHGADMQVSVGHSVGEFAALVASGALEFGDALEAVAWRARLVDESAPEGRMLAVIGLSESEVAELCVSLGAEHAIAPAVFNAPRHVVVSGTCEAVSEAAGRAKKVGAIRVLPLKARHAFHSPLMEAVTTSWRDYLDSVPIRLPSRQTILAGTAEVPTSAHQIRQELANQLTRPVRWVDTIEAVIEGGVRCAIEVGPGRFLTSLCRHIDQRLNCQCIAQARSLDDVVAASREA
jgi:[acyl-carrier-protein] S-malonyltransferase